MLVVPLDMVASEVNILLDLYYTSLYILTQLILGAVMGFVTPQRSDVSMEIHVITMVTFLYFSLGWY
jgi:hypothetical protein